MSASNQNSSGPSGVSPSGSPESAAPIDARIALDAMGGDRAPSATVEGAVAATDRDPALGVVLVGDSSVIRAELTRLGRAESERLSITHASQAVGGGDAASQAVRLRDNSIRRGVELVRDNVVHGLVAAGNTAATVAASYFILKRLPGVERPGIAVTLPTADGLTVLCDAGANIHCKPRHLLHYGIMAAQYARALLGHARPSVGLLNIGSEEGKGNDLVKETRSLFADAGLNFVGNVEGNDVFNGRCDVVVCEGFVGNVVLKTAEGLYEVVSTRMKDLVATAESSTVGEDGRAVLHQALGRFRANMDYAEHGGAPLLGIEGLVLISHGRSDARAIRNALQQAARMHRKGVLPAMVRELLVDATRSAP